MCDFDKKDFVSRFIFLTLNYKSYIINIHIFKMRCIMKKTLTIVLIIFFVLFGVAAAACIWQWDNIKAVYIGLNSTPEKINSLINENEAKTNKILEKITDVQMRPLTDEERKQLETGELSEEDALKLIMGIDKESKIFEIELKAAYLYEQATKKSLDNFDIKNIPIQIRKVPSFFFIYYSCCLIVLVFYHLHF